MRAVTTSPQLMSSIDCMAHDSNATASQMSPKSAHRAGFRDCGLVAIDYLTNVARLDPNGPVVVGVKRLVERGCVAPADRRRRRNRPAAAGRRRPRPTTDQENRRPTEITDACSLTTTTMTTMTMTNGVRSHLNTVDSISVHGPGRVAFAENRLLLSGTSPSQCSPHYGSHCHTNDETTTAPSESLTFCSPFNRNQNHADGRRRPPVERHSLKFDGDVSRFVAGKHLPDRPETLFRDDETSAASTVVECARILDGLARTDSRVENLLTEIMDLMDEESDECIEQ